MNDRTIQILPERIASQIAAGEVVERPASAVKELVENAIDAGARSISIEIAGAGRELIAVSDDGAGMSRDDALMSIRRHATSKIRDIGDLQGILTMGFRGEALASIASVSNLTIRTRRAEDSCGVELKVEGGECSPPTACAIAVGTRVEARNLFFNTPARLKFLKTAASEQGAIVDTIQRLSLTAPELAFKLIADGRTILELAAARSLIERFRQLFGPRLAEQMLPFNATAAGIGLDGIAASSQISFASPRMIFGAINRRVVRDRMLSRAAVQAYQTLLPRGRYPAVVMAIRIPPQEVDVNVHPMKTEVRFRNPGAVFATVYRTIRPLLASGRGASGVAPEPGLTPDGVLAAQGQVVRADAVSTFSGPSAGAAVSMAEMTTAAGSPGPRPLRLVTEVSRPILDSQAALRLGWNSGSYVAPAGQSTADEPSRALPVYSELKVVGQIFAGYIALEGPGGLVLIDQHAAHERVTFERLKAQMAAGGITVQALLNPVPIELDPSRTAAIEAGLATLNSLGFDLECFGHSTLLLKGAPAVFDIGDAARLVTDMLDEIGDGVGSSATIFESLLKQLACHGSIRVGRLLDAAEIARLLQDLDRTPFRTNCPHGRPTHINFGRSQIERMFRR